MLINVFCKIIVRHSARRCFANMFACNENKTGLGDGAVTGSSARAATHFFAASSPISSSIRSSSSTFVLIPRYTFPLIRIPGALRMP